MTTELSLNVVKLSFFNDLRLRSHSEIDSFTIKKNGVEFFYLEEACLCQV